MPATTNTKGRVVIAHSKRTLFLSILIFVAICCVDQLHGQSQPNAGSNSATNNSTPAWIWTPEHQTGQVPQSACHFRKTIHLNQKPDSGNVQIAADDIYELFVNGRRVGRGAAQDKFNVHDVSTFLREGKNVIAVKVTNRNGAHAGLAAKVETKSASGNPRYFVTNPTWRTSLKVLPLWNSVTYRDDRWTPASNLGLFGKTAPWSEGVVASNQPTDQPQQKPKRRGLLSVVQKETTADGGPSTKTSPEDEHPRFRLPAGFQVQHVVGHAKTGSLIAMAFNEFGQILASQEGGPLLLIYDTNKNGIPDNVRVCCERVQNCQGILALSGNIYVVADGPAGAGLYRLSDEDQDGVYEVVSPIVRFEGSISEHGPHGLVLGPDAMLYIALGNHTKLIGDYANTSPHNHYYEGDLQHPRYEDPRGHAAGIKAPGGGILRTDFEGQRVELIAGGMRNVYDIAFNRHGDLFAHDSDMESDAGTPWHRPTRLLHVTPGSEFGWRSGWAKWPEYFADSLPAILDTGRGSPTGSVVYDHYAYPERYRQSLFSCDWAQGEIYSISLKKKGASYEARREIFLQGRPLNVTDIDVGPDGWIYFTTGGRGTRGNLYRVVWNGQPVKKPSYSGLSSVVRQPQLSSGWARQRASTSRRDYGEKWDRQILKVVFSAAADGYERMRAMELMHMVGPPPTDTQLAALADQKDSNVRAKAAYYLGLIHNDVAAQKLIDLLEDRSPKVRRAACEALLRTQTTVPLEMLKKLIASEDKVEAWAARKLLETGDLTEVRREISTTNRLRTFIQLAMAVLIAEPDPGIAKEIAVRATTLTQGFVPKSDMLDVVRVMQLALLQGKITGNDIPEVATWVSKKFPANEAVVNRELVRLIVGAQFKNLTGKMVSYLQSDIKQIDKLHIATQLRFLQGNWKPAQQAAVMMVFQEAKDYEGGKNLGRYAEKIGEDFGKDLPIEAHDQILAAADRMPDMAINSMFALPESADAQIIPRLIELDRRLVSLPNDNKYHDLRVGIVAILARHGSEDAMAYLREIFDRDPQRRQVVAMGLAQRPGGRNWDYLVRSLPLLDGEPCREVLLKLTQVDFAPESPEHYRQVILAGLRLKHEGGALAANLLNHWVGEEPPNAGVAWDTRLSAWQRWFDVEYPAQPVANLPQESGNNRWTYNDLLAYLDSADGKSGSVERGAQVYQKAQCADCHVHGGVGSDLGPDLTTLANRFQKREILESIVYPSQVISDQYATKTILTDDGDTIVGMIVPGQDDEEITVLLTDGTTKTIARDNIEEMAPSRTSSMPEGLLNNLSLEEIADLMVFLMTPPEPEVAERP